MTGRERAKILERMHEAVVEQRYIMTDHALLEMEADDLDFVDVESAILTGIIRRVFDDDPPDQRYEVVGKACDLITDVAVVARFAGSLLIITVYDLRQT